MRKFGKSGKKWETIVRTKLKADFNTEAVFRLSDVDRVDFVVIHTRLCDGVDIPAVALVEAKSTTADIYRPLDHPKLRVQWEYYFLMRDILERIGIPTSVWLYLKKPDGIWKLSFNSYSDIASKY